MNAIEIIRWIRMEHDALNELLEEGRSLALEAVPGGKRDLRKLVMVFLSHVDHHLELEERSLVPLMKRAGLWTPERAARFEADHAAQRELLARMSRHQHEAGPELVQAVVSLADAFWDESNREKQDVDAVVDRLHLR